MNAKTVNCIVVVSIRASSPEGYGENESPGVQTQLFPATELRAGSDVELAAQARSFALMTIRLGNRAGRWKGGERELVSVDGVRDIEKCPPTCHTCKHKLKRPNQMPCCRCNEFYNMWK